MQFFLYFLGFSYLIYGLFSMFVASVETDNNKERDLRIMSKGAGRFVVGFTIICATRLAAWMLG